MSDLVRSALAHPLERKIDGAAVTRDRISLRDYIVATEIGAFQIERDLVQRLRFNIVVDLKQATDGVGDDVDLILSYDKLTEAIEAELASGRKDLLETVADNVAARILQEPQAFQVIVRVEKLDRIPGALGVEVVRTADENDTVVAAADTPTPTILLLPFAALGSDNLSAWIDASVAFSAPVIVCIGFDTLPDVSTPDPSSQRRIDLLTIEQTCWRLAAMDARCVVVDSKTELDWGLRNDQISVWAPSRLILNSVGAPTPDRTRIADYVAWFADVMCADRIVVVDQDAPSTSLSVVNAELGTVQL